MDGTANAWDGTRLIAHIDGDDALIAGGPEESVLQPVWEPGGTLLFLSDRSGWWNLYRWWPSDEIEQVVGMEAEIGEPQWVFGRPRYALCADDSIAFAYWRDGFDHLSVVDQNGVVQDLDLPYCEWSDLSVTGTMPPSPPHRPRRRRVAVDLPTAAVRPAPRRRGLDPGFLPPAGPDFRRPAAAPPLVYAPQPSGDRPTGRATPVITVHGPTAAAALLALDIRFWTSRGFSVVDVNYGGSTGYGRLPGPAEGRWGSSRARGRLRGRRPPPGRRGRADPAGCASPAARRRVHRPGLPRLQETFSAGAASSAYALGPWPATPWFEPCLDSWSGHTRPAASTWPAPHPPSRRLRPASSSAGPRGRDRAAQPVGGSSTPSGPRACVAYLPFEGGSTASAGTQHHPALEAELSFFAQLFGFALPEMNRSGGTTSVR